MNDQERQLITDFVRRVAGADRSSGGPSPWAGQQQQAAPAPPPLPPVDRDADGLILELFNKHPEARYRVTQTAFVQEHALAEAQNRIQQLEYELERTRREAQAAPSGGGGGFLGGLFGGGRPAPQQPMPPPPQPVHAPGYQPGMFGDPRQQQGRSGMGFLGTAGAAMAGVAGGMVAGSVLSSMMGGGHGAAQAAEAPAAAATPAAGAAPEGGWGTPTAAPDDAGWGGDDEEV